MSLRLPLVVAALFAAAVSCAPQPTVDIEEDARAALRDAASRYAEAAVGRDVDAFLGFYAQDAVIYPPGADSVTGLDAIGNMAATMWSDPEFGGTSQLLVTDVSIDGTMGYTISTGDVTATGPDGQPVTERVRDFHVWRRESDGAWKVVVDIWNAEPSAAR